MKRSVAILGPTPAFMRWAVWHDCPFRPLESTRFIDQSFRRLRGIRAYSDAHRENRCWHGFCFHPEVTATGPDGQARIQPPDVRGFHEDEVLGIWGGAAAVSAACQDCPANLVPGDRSGLAGCFGFLSTTRFDLERCLAGHDTPDDPSTLPLDLPAQLNRLVDRHSSLEADLAIHFGSGPSVWHRLWSAGSLFGDRLALVVRLFAQLNPSTLEIVPVRRFVASIESAQRRDLTLQCQALPRGHSDGECWELPAHCRHCGWEVEPIQTGSDCPGCGRRDGLTEGQRLKVLGMRPYVHLAGILGLEQAAELTAQYRAGRQSGPNESDAVPR